MLYETALVIAERAKSVLGPHCERFEIAGSIRRRRQFCHDIDVVVVPGNQGAFLAALQFLGKMKSGGEKMMQVQMNGAVLDVYIATPETWATLLLIKTGSAAHNRMLCGKALSKGMKLHADGTGLFRPSSVAFGSPAVYLRVAGDTEDSIFNALGMPYIPPERREVL